MKNVAIIGAGQLGSRHLQAMALCEIPCEIIVVDPNAESLETAGLRWDEMQNSRHKVHYYQTLPEDIKHIDLLITACNADHRASVIRNVLKQADVTAMVLEKVLFQKPADYIEIKNLLSQKQVAAWVNCPRRIWPIYQMMKDEVNDGEFVHMAVSGSSWGMGCNAIHMIDLASWLAGERNYKITHHNLDAELIPSKRQGYNEITGSFDGLFPNGATFSISSYAQSGIPYTLQVQTKNFTAIVHEDLDYYWLYKDGEWSRENLIIPYQSQLTGVLVQNLFENDTCPLTPFEDSVALHLPMLDMFLSHPQIAGEDKCPIT